MAITLHEPTWDQVAQKYNPIDVAQVVDNFRQLKSAIESTGAAADPAAIAALQAAVAALGLADRIPSRADFDARATAVRGLTAGSGFLDWGGNIALGFADWFIGPGMTVGRWVDAEKRRIFLGGMHVAGLQQGSPLISCLGTPIFLQDRSPAPAWSVVSFPPPPESLGEYWRQDLVILEVWHESVALKDVVYPLGHVQFGSTKRYTDNYLFLDGSVVALSSNLVDARYCSFGEWDANPAGGLALRWSALSDAQRRMFAADSKNNVFLDYDGSHIQVRWRYRVIKGRGTASWAGSNPLTESELYYTPTYGDGVVVPRGQRVENTDYTPYDPNCAFFGAHVLDEGNQEFFGHWTARDTISRRLVSALAWGGQCYALPIALVSRNRNTGIYHATHNPNGCASATGASPASSAECYALPRTSGLLGSTSAHPSGYCADEIIPDDVEDQRMYARPVNYKHAIEESYARYRIGRLHRKKYVLPSSSVDKAVVSASPVICPSGVNTKDCGYNQATGEIVYPTTYAGAGAVSVATLAGTTYGQGIMQIATDPAADGVIDIDLSDATCVQLPYFVFKEPNGVRNIP